MSENTSSRTDIECADQSGGFQFRPSSGDHEIEIDYSWRYVDRIELAEGQTKRIDDPDGYFGGDEEYSCTCGAEFDSETDAKDHLHAMAARGPPVKTASRPRPIEWQDQTEAICDGQVEIILSAGRSVGRVLDGAEYLVTTSRATYTPPANYTFDDWGPLESGRLTLPNGRPQFSSTLLTRVLETLSPSYNYHPERFTIFYRGADALYVEGPTEGIMIAECSTAE
ncbi:hypothetical protein [Haloarcula sp. JP-L23]|uniref:hypothetical protein n=1 Tax=Haloarcula sp. JP-L23 TaxID=2716717 RepID=UPI00140EDA9B|nr:hypothetical protein G9465_22400 [Haloarcula sp. JP-L23]